MALLKFVKKDPPARIAASMPRSVRKSLLHAAAHYSAELGEKVSMTAVLVKYLSAAIEQDDAPTKKLGKEAELEIEALLDKQEKEKSSKTEAESDDE